MTSLDPQRSLLEPRYGEESLADLLPSILGALRLPGEENVLRLPPANRYCLLLVDGLGSHLLQRNPSVAPFLTAMAGTGRVLTVGVPTTTATSLTSLGTGLAPGRHGLVGYTSRVPGTNELLNALTWDKPVDALTYQPYPTMFERAAAAGISVAQVAKRRFRRSGLTTVGLRGSDFRGSDTVGERIAATAQAVGEGERSLVYVYDGDLDYTGHRQGCESAAWRYELARVDRFAEQVHELLPPDAVLLVTGDHGMIDVPFEDRVDADAVPELRDGVELIGGEARLRHVYTRAGAGDDVIDTWLGIVDQRAAVLSRDEAIARGWFGAVEDRVRDRLGDVVVAALGRFAIEATATFRFEASLIGLHGSLSPDELLVPLISLPG